MYPSPCVFPLFWFDLIVLYFGLIVLYFVFFAIRVFACFYCCSSVCDAANWTQASTPHLHFIAATPLWARPGHRHGKLEWRRATFQTDIWANHMAGFMQAVILGQSHSQIYASSYLGQSHCSIYKNILAKSHSYISFKMIFGPIRTTKLMIFGQLFC